MIQISETLWAGEMPVDGRTTRMVTGVTAYPSIGKPDEDDDFILVYLPPFWRWATVGFVTKDSIDFDPEPYVARGIFCGGYAIRFIDYRSPLGNFVGAHDSLRSLLKSKGLYFENPLGKEPELFDSSIRMQECKYEYPHGYDIDQFRIDLKAWQEAESKLIRGKILIIEKL